MSCHGSRQDTTFWTKARRNILRVKTSTTQPKAPRRTPTIALVGSPNVGKSALFNRLTGTYVTVSNYPGTTVEVFRGKSRIGGMECSVVDTPGTYSLLPLTEEEKITRSLLIEENPDIVLHVVDAKNISRMISLTIQLIETGLPVILVLNVMDEAESLGVCFNIAVLEKQLGIPVVATSAALNRGIGALKDAIGSRLRLHNVAD